MRQRGRSPLVCITVEGFGATGVPSRPAEIPAPRRKGNCQPGHALNRRGSGLTPPVAKRSQLSRSDAAVPNRDGGEDTPRTHSGERAITRSPQLGWLPLSSYPSQSVVASTSPSASSCPASLKPSRTLAPHALRSSARLAVSGGTLGLCQPAPSQTGVPGRSYGSGSSDTMARSRTARESTSGDIAMHELRIRDYASTGACFAPGRVIGANTCSMAARSASNCGGSLSDSPRVASGSSIRKPGPSVATSNRTPPGSRK